MQVLKITLILIGVIAYASALAILDRKYGYMKEGVVRCNGLE